MILLMVTLLLLAIQLLLLCCCISLTIGDRSVVRNIDSLNCVFKSMTIIIIVGLTTLIILRLDTGYYFMVSNTII